MLVLSCWEKGQVSPLHDHAGARAWVKVLQGQLKDTQYTLATDSTSDPLVHKSEKLHGEDSVIVMDGASIHQMENVTDTMGVSMQLYSPPYNECYCYCKKTGQKRLMDVHHIFQERSTSPCSEKTQPP